MSRGIFLEINLVWLSIPISPVYLNYKNIWKRPFFWLNLNMLPNATFSFYLKSDFFLSFFFFFSLSYFFIFLLVIFVVVSTAHTMLLLILGS
jgi:hypothetical protein